MKILSRKITASSSTSGTTYYEVTKDLILKNSIWGKNVWLQYLLDNYPLEEAINPESLMGIFISSDEVYLCVTDFQPIEVNGQEVNPEEAFKDYSVEDLEDYVSVNTPDAIVKSHITDSDFDWNLLGNIEKVAQDLLSDYDLATVAKDAEDIGLIEL